MNADEPSASSLCARLYHVILEAFRNVISCTQDPQLLSKIQICGQRFKLWAAGLCIENGDLDAQLDDDTDMKDSVLLLLGLILYDLHKCQCKSQDLCKMLISQQHLITFSQGIQYQPLVKLFIYMAPAYLLLEA